MKPSITAEQTRLLRLRAQQLWIPDPAPAADPQDVVSAICGVQAQDASAAALSVRVRCPGVTAGGIESALARERTLVRTGCMRNTLHLLATEDVGWLLDLLGPIFIQKSRRRRAELGLDDEICERGTRVIRAVLAGRGPLTRAELVEALANRRIAVAGQAVYHLIRYAALKGVVCYGPNRDTAETFVLLDDWVDRRGTVSTEKSTAELARRYLKGYAPAMPEDFASWSGLTLTDSRRAWQDIEGELVEVDINGQPAWMLKSQSVWLAESPPTAPIVRLLPRFDTSLIGYRRRNWMVESRFEPRIYPGGGWLRETVLVNGAAVATWSTKAYASHTMVIVDPFEPLPQYVWPGLEAEVADIGRFLDVDTRLDVREPA